MHLRQHHVAALTASFGIAHGIEKATGSAHTNKSGRLRDREVLWLLVEISGSGSLDATYGIAQEVKVVQIECYYFFFFIVTVVLA